MKKKAGGGGGGVLSLKTGSCGGSENREGPSIEHRNPVWLPLANYSCLWWDTAINPPQYYFNFKDVFNVNAIEDGAWLLSYN